MSESVKYPDSFWLYTTEKDASITLHRSVCAQRRRKVRGTRWIANGWTGPLTADVCDGLGAERPDRAPHSPRHAALSRAQRPFARLPSSFLSPASPRPLHGLPGPRHRRDWRPRARRPDPARAGRPALRIGELRECAIGEDEGGVGPLVCLGLGVLEGGQRLRLERRDRSYPLQ